MTRLRILELPHDRDADGRFIPGPTPFVLIFDEVPGHEAAAIQSGAEKMAEQCGARGAAAFPVTVDLRDDPEPEPLPVYKPITSAGLAEALRRAQESAGLAGFPDVTPDGVSTIYPGRAGG